MGVKIETIEAKTPVQQITDRSTVELQKWTYSKSGTVEYIVFLSTETLHHGTVVIHMVRKSLRGARALFNQLVKTNIYGYGRQP
jgi:hypothetical protein